MRLSYRLFALAVVPAVFLFTAFVLNTAKGPFWLGYNSDPSYMYLLNSLNLAMLKPVYHIDHPGTPVQMLGAVVIKLFHINSTATELQKHILSDPEFYLSSINIVLIILNAFSLLMMGCVIHYMTKKIQTAMMMQCIPFYSSTILVKGINNVAPEPLLLFSSVALITILMVSTFNENGKYHITAMSVVSGFGVATKITYLPLLLIPMIILPKIREKIFFLLGTTISFVFFTFPIISKYEYFYNWILGMVTHKGRYGQGAQGMIDLRDLIHNIATLIGDNPGFSIILIIAVAVSIYHAIQVKGNKRIVEKEFKLLIAIILAQILGILLCGSRPPTNHYLLPVLCLSALTVYLVVFFLKETIQFNNKPPAGIITVCGLFFSFWIILLTIKNAHAVNNELFQNSESVIQKINRDYPQYIKVPFYGSSSQCYALFMGNGFAGSEHSKCLADIYGQVLFLNIWGNIDLRDYERYYRFESLLKITDKILFYGLYFNEEHTYASLLTPTGLVIELQKSYKDKFESIYILKSYRYN